MTDRIGQQINLEDTAIFCQSKGFAQGIGMATVVELITNLPQARVLLLTLKAAKVTCKAADVIIYKGAPPCLLG